MRRKWEEQKYLNQIIKWIGFIAYELSLPHEARIHLVFHVLKLKSFFGQPLLQILPIDDSVTWVLVPLQLALILGKNKLHTAKGVITHVLVHWEGLSAAEETWENWLESLKAYLNCKLEDKVNLDVGANKYWALSQW